MTRSFCSVPNCDCVKGDVQLFHTPKDRDLTFRWKKAIGSKETMQEWKRAMVCEKHFEESCFDVIQSGKSFGRRKLIKGAMPTLNLPEFAVLAEIHNYASKGGSEDIKMEVVSVVQEEAITDVNLDEIEPEKEDLSKAALDVELAKSVAKGLTSKSMTRAKKQQILSKQDLIEKEAIKQLRNKINGLKEDKRILQKESSNLDIKLRKLNKRMKSLTEKEKEVLVEKYLHKHFSKAQIRCFVRGNWQMSKLWEEKDYKLALVIHTLSRRCFHYLRNHQILPMPSFTSLKKHTFDDGTDIKTSADVNAVLVDEQLQPQEVIQDDTAGHITVDSMDATQIVHIPSDQVQVDPQQAEGTQIVIDGQSYTVEGQPFTLEGQQIQIAEGGQIITADGQLITQEGGITVMNVIDPSQLQELQVGSVVSEQEVQMDPSLQQVQYYVV